MESALSPFSFPRGAPEHPISALKHWPQQKSLEKVRFSRPRWRKPLRSQFPDIWPQPAPGRAAVCSEGLSRRGADGLVTLSRRAHPTTLGSTLPHTPVGLARLFLRAGGDFSDPADHFTDGPREESESLEVTYKSVARPQPGQGLFPATGAPSVPGARPVPTPGSRKSRGTMGSPITPAWQSWKVWLV